MNPLDQLSQIDKMSKAQLKSKTNAQAIYLNFDEVEMQSLKYKAESLESRLNKDQKMAFTTVIRDGGYHIGLAVQDETGYYPTNISFKSGTQYDVAVKISEELNREILKIDPKEAMMIVLSSIGKK